jgi:uncharacterized Zn finger protein (UPF0148 family)
MKNQISYNHWISGERITEVLNQGGKSRKPLSVYCPFDSTPILSCNEGKIHSYECPNCGENYYFKKKPTQEQAEIQAREKITIARTTIEQFRERQKRLERMIELAEEKNLFGEAHKEGTGVSLPTAD